MEANTPSDPWLEDNDFSETANFINQILMEENFDECPFYDSFTLQVTEKSFYDALTGTLPLSPTQNPLVLTPQAETTNKNDFSDENFRELKQRFQDSAFQFNPQVSQPHLDSSTATVMPHNKLNDGDYVCDFRRGLEEGRRFLPAGSNLVTLKGRKNHERHERDTIEEEEEGRSNKQSALSVADEIDLSEAIDRVSLSSENVCDEQSCFRSGGKGRPKKQGRNAWWMKKGKEKEIVDLRNLLLMCAQSVYANDNRTANEYLKQIRQNSSPTGDALQRLAHYFANGLEARMVGDGTSAQGMFSILNSRVTPVDLLKTYQVILTAVPFKKFAYFFANKMIREAAAKAETVHIIDFGILYGFHWPMLIKFLSNREGGPPKLRITGIEFPLPGFRPTQKIEETGRHLANYCKRYNVPFEYHAIASKNWETIQVEALQIERNELVAVNSLMRFENLLDETFHENSPRNAVLHLIRKIKPDIFTQTVINGSFNAPFFTTRFREALFHYYTLYDMCDAVVPRENEWRMLIEREIVGREAMNVIACEGSERIERPETYKKWYIRNTRAGFKQLPLNEELMEKCRSQLREWYHRDFFVDEDNEWMLQGWKGRVLYASSCWVPA
ncbi:scarecrow-like protein 33 isoform X2 [Cajanus cajan]|nr:scarecrow-like protein 33 isoform X1 [Cajanus cajan]XP_029127111.1 scarecrow-like protein 33 isoform X2 [Cajanus cajan]